jgi:hypothetical protein
MNLPSPPSSVSGPLGEYLRVLHSALQNMPNWSTFSLTVAPNSLVTGAPGDILINLTSADTTKRAWQMGGSVRISKLTGWEQL